MSAMRWMIDASPPEGVAQRLPIWSRPKVEDYAQVHNSTMWMRTPDTADAHVCLRSAVALLMRLRIGLGPNFLRHAIRSSD